MFYLNSTLNFGIPPELVFQLEVYYVVDRLLAGLTAKQKGTTARWYSNKTSHLLHRILILWLFWGQTSLLKTGLIVMLRSVMVVSSLYFE